MATTKGFYKEGGKTKPITSGAKIMVTGNPQAENSARREIVRKSHDQSRNPKLSVQKKRTNK